jgi:hypothetical protein
MGINWSSAYEAGQHTSTVAPVTAPTPTPAVHVVATSSATPSPTAAAKSDAASPVNSIVNNVVSDVESLFDGLVGLANDLTSFGEATAASGTDVSKIGNIGNPQGSNMIKVASAEGYQYTNTFINTSPQAMTVAIWNKAFNGGNGVEANLGSCVAPETPALTFALAPGASQVVAFMEDSQIGWAQATSARTSSGAFDTTWGEANFASSGSGYDMSAIMNSAGNNYDMAISASETPCISDPTQNYWMAANNNPNDPQPVGSSDGSCYIPGSSATLVTKMGGVMA